jgi:PIG-P
MFLIFIYVALLSYNVEYLTMGMSSVECMVDDAANVALVDEYGRLIKGGSKRLVAEQEKAERRRASLAAQSSKKKGKAKVTGNSRKVSNGSAYANGHANGADPDHYESRHQAWNWRATWNEGTDAVMDVPLGGVCEVLYGEGRDNSRLAEPLSS